MLNKLVKWTLSSSVVLSVLNSRAFKSVQKLLKTRFTFKCSFKYSKVPQFLTLSENLFVVLF